MGLRPGAVLSGAIVGIDPGRRGAMVAIEGGEVVASLMMPYRQNALDHEEVLTWLERRDIRMIVIEKQHAMPRQGLSSMFTLGYRYGELCGIARALRFHLECPSPQTWQKIMLKGADGYGKLRALGRVKELLPGLGLRPGRCRVDQDGLADAGLLALYGEWVIDKERSRARFSWID